MSVGRESVFKYWEEEGAQKNFSTPVQMELLRRFVDKKATVLDVGCGYGRILRSLVDAGYENVSGVEPSTNLMARSDELGVAELIMPMQDGKIPFADSSIDAVLLIAVLTCVPSDAEQDKLVSEIYRVLKSGGIFYINDFLLNTDQRNLDRYAEFEGKHGQYGIFELEGGGVLRHFSEEHIDMLLDRFETVEYEKITYTTMNKNKSNGFYYLGRKD